MAAVLEEKTFRSLKEVSVLAFLAGSVYFLISLVTYNNEDAGWTHSSTIQSVTNAGGFIGAWLADFCLSFFGVLAYLIPVAVLRHAYLSGIQSNTVKTNNLIILHWLGSAIVVLGRRSLVLSPYTEDRR